MDLVSCAYGLSFVDETSVVRVTVHEPPHDIRTHYPIHLNHLLEPVSSIRIRHPVSTIQ